MLTKPVTRLMAVLLLSATLLPGRAQADEESLPSPNRPPALSLSPLLSLPAGEEPLPTGPELPLAVAVPAPLVQDETQSLPMIDLTVAPDSLWQRMRNGFGMPDLHTPHVADRQSWYLNRPEMVKRIFERGRRYLFHIVEELEKRGMPTELALLPMVESAFNPKAVSSARAMGIWQFIPSTGKTYNLDQNWWVDERRDIIASTGAALNYLQNIYEMHGDWHLALASYNWGEHAVARAIAKNKAKDLPTDYASLTMPAETRYYVPKLQALKNIVAQAELFGIHLPDIPNQPYFETVMKPQRLDIAVAAKLAEIPVEEFISLNPAYHRPVINGSQAGPLVLPADKIDTFNTNLQRYEAADIPLSNWQTHTLKRGETIESVAARYGISAERLRQINGITRRVKTGPGFNLLVPHPGAHADHEAVARALPQQMPEKVSVAQADNGKKKKDKATTPSSSKSTGKSAKKPKTGSAPATSKKPADKPSTKATAQPAAKAGAKKPDTVAKKRL